MDIAKSGFYNVSDLLENNTVSEINILNNITVSLYDDTDIKINITVGEKSFLEYFSYFSGDKDSNLNYTKNIFLVGNNAKSKVNSLNYSCKNTISCKIISELKSDNGTTSVNILSFAGESGNIRVDGVLKVDKNTRGNDGILDEENIFLGESGKISGIPTLFVETNDMQASHACRMEKISDEKLFYLRSRGIGRDNALQMIIEAKIRDLYKCLEMYNKDFFNELMTKILTEIK